MKASNFIADLRQKMAKENEKILNHRLVKEAEGGSLNPVKLKIFAIQQHYIISYDLRSLATMLARSTSRDEADFFYMLVTGDNEASKQLQTLSVELGLSEDIKSSKLLPRAVVYTHYLAWLANYANPGEQAAALTVNLPVWGSACRRLGYALKEKYHIKNTGFFELFSGPYDAIDEAAARITDRYASSMERCARFIQRYELMFWDSIYEEY